MSKAQVLQTMGTENYKYLTNPYRTENFAARDGTRIEILYYATADRSNDRSFLGDELTPIVLEADRLVGWGWSHLKGNAERYNNPPPVGAP
jgi:hypothetical protein